MFLTKKESYLRKTMGSHIGNMPDMNNLPLTKTSNTPRASSTIWPYLLKLLSSFRKACTT
jgi:hypothetical protein